MPKRKASTREHRSRLSLPLSRIVPSLSSPKCRPNSFYIKKAAKIEKGSKTPGADTAGSITMAQVRDIAKAKMADLNANDIEAACSMIVGSARSNGHPGKGVISWLTAKNSVRP